MLQFSAESSVVTRTCANTRAEVTIMSEQRNGPRVVLLTCRSGCFNVHPSILPSLRGPDPIFRALQRGLTVSGVSIHDVAGEIDAGIIRYQEIIDLPPRASAFGLYDCLIQRGADRLVRFLIGGTHSLPAISPSIAPDYSSFPTADEVAGFVRSGGRLIGLKEWKQALSEIQ